MKLYTLVFLSGIAVNISAHAEESKEEKAPFVQTAPEKTSLEPKRKQVVHSKVTQNKQDQALIALSHSLSKVAEPSKMVAEKQKEEDAPKSSKTRRSSPYVFVRGDFLYLKTENPSLSYGQQVPTAQLTTASPFTDLSGQTQRIQPSYHPGFLIEIGTFLAKNKGTITLAWTHLYNSENADTDTTSGKLILPSTANTNGSPLAQSASAHWHMHFNLFDLSYGKQFNPLPVFSFKPFIGLRGAWISQKFDTHYATIFYSLGNRGATLDTYLENQFRGIGLRAALDGCWNAPLGFVFFAKGGLSLLVSHITVKQKEDRASGIINTVKDSLHPLTPTFELAVGTGWNRAFDSGRFLLSFELGWQELSILDETVWQRSNQAFEKEDLGLTGYFLGARIAF